jgi:hypothetical protein
MISATLVPEIPFLRSKQDAASMMLSWDRSFRSVLACIAALPSAARAAPRVLRAEKLVTYDRHHTSCE